MTEIFPLKQVMGFVFSLILTAVALGVYFFDMPFAVGMTVLLLTAFAQAGLQLIVFMHAGETEDKGSIYINIYYGLIIALITIFGTLLAMVWNM